MTVQAVIDKEFTEQDRAEMAEANRRLKRLYDGGHLDEWLAYVPKLTAIRTAAMHAAQTNNMKDRRYGIALKEIMRQLLPKFLDGATVRAEATHLMWLGEEAERLAMLAEHRSKLTPAQHVGLATPKGARNCVARVIAARDQPQPAQPLAKPAAAAAAAPEPEPGEALHHAWERASPGSASGSSPAWAGSSSPPTPSPSPSRNPSTRACR